MTQLEKLDRTHLIHPVTEFRDHEKTGPKIVTGGEGIRIHLADGSTLIDACSGLWNINVGHGRSEIADAVNEQIRELPYYNSFFKTAHPPAIELSRLVCSLAP